MTNDVTLPPGSRPWPYTWKFTYALIAANEPCTRQDLLDAGAYPDGTARNALSKLQRRGVIESIPRTNGDGREVRYRTV